MLELADDLAAEWFLDLWHQAPTPAKAARLRETTVERVLKAHRIRRWQAPEVLRILRQKPLSVAPGVAAAASAHIAVVAARIRLVNQQLKAAHRKLDQLCDQLIPPAESAPGQYGEQRDVVILRSMPGLGRITLAALLPTGLSRGAVARAASWCAAMPATSGSKTRSITGRASPPSTTRPAGVATPRCADTATAAPCAPSPTACCRWPVPCSSGRPCSPPLTSRARPPHEHTPVPIPLFDRQRPSLRPDLPTGRAPRAAAVKDAAVLAAAPAQPARSVLDRASTVLCFRQ